MQDTSNQEPKFFTRFTLDQADTTMFGYPCQECGKGTVQDKIIPEYPTKIQGQPFTVPQAHIGVCNQCQAQHFSAQEYKRWEEMFTRTNT